MRSLATGIGICLQHAEENCTDAGDRGLVKLRQLSGRLEPLQHLDPSSWPGIFLDKLQIDATAGQKNSWRGQSGAANKAMRAELRRDLAALRQAIGATLLNGVLRWLEDFRRDYGSEKRRRGVVDFQDLLLEARRLVRDDPRTRRDLASRIDMLCVDEFQDTDPLQAELVLFLSETGGPAADWRDVRVGPQLFLVGDPRQSIYRFRRADLDVYGRCAQIVLDSGGKRLDIVQNFRSRPAVLQWVNGVFEHLFAPADGPRHVPLAAATEPGAKPAVWILRAPPRPAGAPSGDWRRAEAVALAAWIQAAIAAQHPVRDTDGDGEHPLRPGDIALLFGRTSGIELYEAALRDAGLPSSRKAAACTSSAKECATCCRRRRIDDPHDELAVVAACCARRSSGPAKSCCRTASSTRSAISRRHRNRRSGRAWRFSNGCMASVSNAAPPTPSPRCWIAPRAAPARGAPAAGARQHRALDPPGATLRRAHPELRAFVRSLRDFDTDAPRLAEWAPQDAVDDRVRLLTVHMAKGLEFPCVLLANLSTGAGAQRPVVVVDRLADAVEVRLRTRVFEPIATPGWEAIDRVGRERDSAEEKRLLYVAATRARDYLVVPCFFGQRPAGLLEALTTAPGALGDEGFGELPPPGEASGWCVVDASLEPPIRRAAPRAERAALRPLWARRAAWGEEHAARLERGRAGAGVLRPDASFEPAVGVGEWMRTRRLLATVLDTVAARRAPDASPEDLAALVAATAREVAGRQGVAEQAEDLGREALCVAGGAWRTRRAFQTGPQRCPVHCLGWPELDRDLDRSVVRGRYRLGAGRLPARGFGWRDGAGRRRDPGSEDARARCGSAAGARSRHV
jgi:ATP-dependent helicase/nuclease subunit A